MHTHELPYVRIIKPACADKIMHGQISTQKTLKTQKQGRTSKLEFYQPNMHLKHTIRKPKLDKNVKTYYNKQTKQTKRFKA